MVNVSQLPTLSHPSNEIIFDLDWVELDTVHFGPTHRQLTSGWLGTRRLGDRPSVTVGVSCRFYTEKDVVSPVDGMKDRRQSISIKTRVDHLESLKVKGIFKVSVFS